MMTINSKTTLSELLKENKQVLDHLQGPASPIQKLRDPTQRKRISPTTTLAEVAAMGGCSVEELLLVLRPQGFEIGSDAAATNQQQEVTEKPDWLAGLRAGQLTELDVRAMLASGHDPIKELMAAYQQLEPGTVLQVITTFVPTPLLRLLESKGAKTYVQKLEPKLVYSYFYKPATAPAE